MSEVGGSLGRQMSGSEMSEVGKCLVVICLVGKCLVGKRPGTLCNPTSLIHRTYVTENCARTGSKYCQSQFQSIQCRVGQA